MTNSINIGSIPQPLQAELQTHLTAYSDAGGDLATLNSALTAQLPTVWVGSEFVARACVRDPSLLGQLGEDLQRSYGAGDMAAGLQARLAVVDDEEGLHRELRRFRLREMVRITWRDLARVAELDETLADLSHMADACISQALAALHGWQQTDWGIPQDEAGNVMPMVVLGMGKLGAYELNVSSDIDLIFAYPEHGETVGGRRQVSHERYFTKLGQRLVQALDNVTGDGFVFRTDMRLRPYGDSGPLAMCFGALEEYYQSQGREWERYAMIKARVVAGHGANADDLMSLLKPFVYRRYIDFGVFESLREMKAMINREMKRKGIEGNVKLGPGGIREVEFIGQAFQLVRGGREPSLQIRPIQQVLTALEALEMLPVFVTTELRAAYRFLRLTENRLQEWRDQQTHLLPTDEADQLRLAFTMGFSDWETFLAELDTYRDRVHGHFQQVFAAPQGEDDAQEGNLLALVWDGGQAPEHAITILADAGYDCPEEVYQTLERFKGSRICRSMSAHGRDRLDRLVPLLLSAVSATDQPCQTIQRIFELVGAIARRSAYVALLVENPLALSQLVRLSSVSAWIAHQLTRYPILLDGLLDPRNLYAPLDIAELERDLAFRLTKLPNQDQEEQMEALRHFKHSNVLKVAAADIGEVMPLMVVSDHLTATAEVVLKQSLEIASSHMAPRHGRPRCVVDGESRAVGFIIVAYGKLGGIELGYGSDLDIVFIHNSDGKAQQTDGDKELENSVYFARLAKRIIHILETPMSAGTLYESDTRLRPSGKSGLLVSGLEAFANYQREQAWTWEHQALVRARVVAGDARLAEEFDGVRREILARERDAEALRNEVVEMREKMREQLAPTEKGVFDLKQSVGGIADIEFMVQYCVLRWAHTHPALLTYTDNIRILEGLAAEEILAADEVTLLGDAYRAYRKRGHHLVLQENKVQVPEQEFDAYRTGVSKIWQRLMLD